MTLKPKPGYLFTVTHALDQEISYLKVNCNDILSHKVAFPFIPLHKSKAFTVVQPTITVPEMGGGVSIIHILQEREPAAKEGSNMTFYF